MKERVSLSVIKFSISFEIWIWYSRKEEKQLMEGRNVSFWKAVEKIYINELLEITEISCQEIRIFYRGMLRVGGGQRREGKASEIGSQNTESELINLASHMCVKL